jgi:hypothetical protein
MYIELIGIPTALHWPPRAFCKTALPQALTAVPQSSLQPSPRAAPAAPAARHQPPVLSVPGGAGLWPAGCRQGWPAAGAGRAGAPRAGVSGKGRLIFLYSALTPRLGNRPYVRVLPGEERF